MDTGSTWCILNPEIVAFLGDVVEETYVPTESLIIRGVRYEGRLIRVGMRLQAAVGEDLEVEATVFVPTLAPEETWDVPDFIIWVTPHHTRGTVEVPRPATRRPVGSCRHRPGARYPGR